MTKAKARQRAKAKALQKAKRAKAAAEDQAAERPGQFDAGIGSIKGPSVNPGANNFSRTGRGAARSR